MDRRLGEEKTSQPPGRESNPRNPIVQPVVRTNVKTADIIIGHYAA
jgi:hypothetical protein